MMKLLACLSLVLLIQSAIGSQDDSYESADFLDSDDIVYSDFPRSTRNDKFLRFGRNHMKYDDNNEPSHEDDIFRPTRGGGIEKNDQFIRFGRSRQDLLRFGLQPQQRTARNKTAFLRFGRSKRQAIPEHLKRRENFLRFGRSSNFMRFGRRELSVIEDAKSQRFEKLRKLIDALRRLDCSHKECIPTVPPAAN
ncbi:FMRFamide-related peptides type HF-4 [Cylas formicarius]|uniref:FMRFamide-related peptides type HF-4 n=1 Tax=Cylas formicarius TaxID=197179 RepID=UPI002958D3B5|nr:FMRFamide-related peptides type HF-4 [Cylas formicarius]XP_060531866.1 FMRFamide-related peptides type HF-4 [Cylas formicarius]